MGNITLIDRNFHYQEVPQNGTFSYLRQTTIIIRGWGGRGCKYEIGKETHIEGTS